MASLAWPDPTWVGSGHARLTTYGMVRKLTEDETGMALLVYNFSIFAV